VQGKELDDAAFTKLFHLATRVLQLLILPSLLEARDRESSCGVPLAWPIFVANSPRSGQFLHGLLAEDPGVPT
jgi:hypothetical protein